MCVFLRCDEAAGERRSSDEEVDAAAVDMQLEAEMTAQLLRTNVRLEAERDEARDEVDRLAAELQQLRADVEMWRSKCQAAQRDAEERRQRLASVELDYNKVNSKYDVSVQIDASMLLSRRIFMDIIYVQWHQLHRKRGTCPHLKNGWAPGGTP